MKNNRMKNLITIFCCIIAIIVTFIIQQFKPNLFGNVTVNKESSSYLEENQLQTIDDSFYDENASDE